MEDEEEDPLFRALIYIIPTIAIIIIVLLFITRITEGAAFNERIYAKKLALLIDNAKPGTTVFLNVDKGAAIAEKFKTVPEVFIEENKIIVKLAPTKTKALENYETFFTTSHIDAKYLPGNKQIQLTIS